MGRAKRRIDGSTWLRYSISVWDDLRKTGDERKLGHPAMFPAALALRLILCLTDEDEDRVVLDPFVGVGSTVVAAEAAGMVGVGLDISEEYVRKALERPALPPIAPGGERRVYVASASDLFRYVQEGTVDLVITSPPYWDILLRRRTADRKETRHYGEDDRDLGRIADYDAFLSALASVFEKVYAALRPGKFCCVVVMDLRKGDRFYPYHADLAQRMTGIGFALEDIIVWNRRSEYNHLLPLGYPSVFRVNKVHEYILLFRKRG